MKTIAMIVASSLALSVSVEAARTLKLPQKTDCIPPAVVNTYLRNLLKSAKNQLDSEIVTTQSNLGIKLSSVEEKAVQNAATQAEFSLSNVGHASIIVETEGEYCVYKIAPGNSVILKMPAPYR